MSDNNTGAAYWRGLKLTSVSLEAALLSGGKYIDAHMRRKCSGSEKQFCHELFAAMYEDKSLKADPATLVYPYSYEEADKRWEASHFEASAGRNTECARAIDTAIRESEYKQDFYNYDIAAMKVIHEFGFSRANLVLSHNIRLNRYDEMYSAANKQWANGLTTTNDAFASAVLDAHPFFVNQFIDGARKLYAEVDADRFALPGQKESGESVHGYEIFRAISFDNRRGFAIGLNPGAASQFVTWQFTEENGKRDYYWGYYCNEQPGATVNYTARVLVYMSGGAANEAQKLPVTAEIPKSEKPRAADKSEPENKPSVLEQIRASEKNPKPPRKEKTPGKKREEEL